jgi:hypothetical protein
VTTLRAPFPWFGGKSRVAHLVWDAFGDVSNYVEPFAGSLAVLLGRPGKPRVETVNDLDCYLANFWRAVQAVPDEVAAHADWPVNEADLHARHRWLVSQDKFRARMRADPEFFDARIAGWWCWGICQWIGSGWCTSAEGRTTGGPHPRGNPGWKGRPAGVAMGVHSKTPTKMPALAHGAGKGVGVHGRRARNIGNAGDWEKRPALGRGGRGVQSRAGRGAEPRLSQQMPNLSGDSGAVGRGIHAVGLAEKLPKMNRGTDSRLQTAGIYAWMVALSERLRRVRVCCGDWQRVLGPAVTTCIGVTGVFLDPPYADTAERDPSLYACDSLEVAHQVREWAIANGDDPRMRIALCGYEGEHAMPASWSCVAWKANGGYGSRNPENENRARERIWFSPHCLGARQRDLFAAVGRQP